jgi:fructose-specific phosphotransferase system IIC component
LVQRIFCPASATQYRFNAFSVLQKLGYVPTFLGLYAVNNTGAQFSAVAAGFLAGYKLITFT